MIYFVLPRVHVIVYDDVRIFVILLLFDSENKIAVFFSFPLLCLVDCDKTRVISMQNPWNKYVKSIFQAIPRISVMPLSKYGTISTLQSQKLSNWKLTRDSMLVYVQMQNYYNDTVICGMCGHVHLIIFVENQSNHISPSYRSIITSGSKSSNTIFGSLKKPTLCDSFIFERKRKRGRHHLTGWRKTESPPHTSFDSFETMILACFMTLMII